jgi:UDPglucose 6-dehydrogenase
MNKISIIGVGKLGLCLALNLERKGYFVLGVDVSQDYIDALSSKSFRTSEPYVNEFLIESKNVEFTTNLERALESNLIFVVVRTPSTNDWKYDHSQIEQIAEKLISFGKQETRKDLIINCTTFPGYCETLQNKLSEYNYKVSYNPEFIAQGTIIKDQLNCDNVLIGQADLDAGNRIQQVYERLCDSSPIFNRMSCTEAELTKLSVNCFLTTKISFANMVGDIAKRLECNADVVLKAIGTDSRIGNKYLRPGFGFGGPCFPRDNRALAKCGEEVGIDAVISKATDEMNEKHLQYQIEDFIKANPDKSIKVELPYVTYKAESTLIEESQQLKYAVALAERGYEVLVLDNREEVKNQIKNVTTTNFKVVE